MNSPILRRLISIFIALLLFVYLGYQIYSANHMPVRTEIALAKTEPETVQTTGVAIRKETIIDQAANGVITYVVEDGGKVAKGGKVAVSYANTGDAAAQQQIEVLDNEISQLQKLNTPGDTYAANPDSLSKQINQQLTDLLIMAETEGFTALEEKRENFLYLLNEKQIVTNKAPDFNERITALQAQRDTIASSHQGQTGAVTAPESGYFISRTDGWESALTYDDAKNLTTQELKTKLETPVQEVKTVGKICHDFKWYFACIVPADRAPEFQEGAGISIDFPFVSTEKVPAAVISVNQESQEEDAAVILECRYMNSALSLIRKETAQLQLTDYSGIIVSRRAVHFATVTTTETDEDGNEITVSKEVKGVYVMHGSEMQFKQIVPLYSTGSHVICDASPPDEVLLTNGTVKLYDEVVVEGTDLYDGKVIK